MPGHSLRPAYKADVLATLKGKSDDMTEQPSHHEYYSQSQLPDPKMAADLPG
jgi:hypothetical protein